MDEYERLEVELSAHYSMYVQAWRNMSYLESELDDINASEEDRIAEHDRELKMMQRRLREEELRVLRGQTKVDERALDEALMAGRDETNRGAKMKRPQGASTRRGTGGSAGEGGGEGLGGDFGGQGGMYGGMAPMEDEEESEEELGEEDEGEGESEMEGEDESDEDGQVEFTNQGPDDEDDLSDPDGGLDGEEDDDDF